MVNEKKINELVERDGKNLVSITMPTHKKGEESKQDPIRFKNLITETVNELTKKGIREADAQDMLKEARALLEKPMFWSHSDHGLAVYISDEDFDVFKLPYEVETQVYVNNHYLITPLLPMLSLDGVYNVLAVSRQKVRLLRCTRNETEDITPVGISTSIEDYLEVDPEKQLQFHTGAKGQKAMYFGHGASEEDKKVIVEQYLREVEKGITRRMRENREPLVIVGLKDNVSIYKSINNYKRLLDGTVNHNPDEASDAELKDKGWEVIKEYFLKDMYGSLNSFSKQTEGRVSNNLSEIAEATVMGRSQTVFISRNEKKWGMYDPDKHTVHYSSQPKNGDVELLNWLSITARKQGGKVYILPKEEMPMHSMVAAEYRF
jgi:hypothetical protein